MEKEYKERNAPVKQPEVIVEMTIEATKRYIRRRLIGGSAQAQKDQLDVSKMGQLELLGGGKNAPGGKSLEDVVTSDPGPSNVRWFRGMLRVNDERTADGIFLRWNGAFSGKLRIERNLERKLLRETRDPRYRVIIRGLPRDYSDRELFGTFSFFGSIARCRVRRDQGGVSLGVAEVTYTSEIFVRKVFDVFPEEQEHDLRRLEQGAEPATGIHVERFVAKRDRVVRSVRIGGLPRTFDPVVTEGLLADSGIQFVGRVKVDSDRDVPGKRRAFVSLDPEVYPEAADVEGAVVDMGEIVPDDKYPEETLTAVLLKSARERFSLFMSGVTRMSTAHRLRVLTNAIVRVVKNDLGQPDWVESDVIEEIACKRLPERTTFSVALKPLHDVTLSNVDVYKQFEKGCIKEEHKIKKGYKALKNGRLELRFTKEDYEGVEGVSYTQDDEIDCTLLSVTVEVFKPKS